MQLTSRELDSPLGVWAGLRRLPVGTTTTYGALGKAVGRKDRRAAVEIGAIVVPCHRVLGAGGDLKGYAWGLHRKQWLLVHERALQAQAATPTTASLF